MDKFVRFLTIILFAVYPILFVYFRNEAFIFKGGVSIPLFISIAGALLIYLFLNFINYRQTNNVLVVVLITMWFLLYGHVYCFLLDFFNIQYSSFRHRFFFPIYSVLFIVPIVILLKAEPVSNKLIYLVFIVGLALNIQFILPGIHSFSAEKTPSIKKAVSPKISDLPDVYYIISDSYPNAGNLKKYYHFDNTNFINELKTLNFRVFDSAQSNYPYTYFSISSSLNMEYINYFEDSVSIKKRNQDFPFTKIHHNKVADYFQSKGYQYILFQSAYKELNDERYADIYLTNESKMNDFYQSLIELSALSCLNIHIYNQEVFNICSNEFQNVLQVPEIKGSKFVFFHCLPPHPPYVFDENGNYINSNEIIENRYKQTEKYINQVKFVNASLLQVIKNILKKSKMDPIIIIQGDHGTCTSEKFENEDKWQITPSKELLKERYGILQAIYIPKKYVINFPKNLMPVNTFRYIINGLFNDTLSILPNKSYFSRYHKEYNFREINWNEVLRHSYYSNINRYRCVE